MSDRLKQPFSTGLVGLVSPRWMAVWNAYNKQADEIERLRAALEWYAKVEHYILAGNGDFSTMVGIDRGMRAREALNGDSEAATDG